VDLENLPDLKGNFGPFRVIEIAEVTWADANRIGIYYIFGKLDNNILVAATEVKLNGGKRTVNQNQQFYLEKVTNYRIIERF